MFAVDIVGQKQRFYFFGFVVAVKKVPDASGKKRHKLRDFAGGDSTKPFGRAEKLSPPIKRLRARLRRRLEEKWLQIVSQPFEAIVYADKSLRVLGTYLAQLFDHSVALRPPGNQMTIGERHLQRGVAGHHAQPVLG